MPTKFSALKRSLGNAGKIDQDMLRYVLDQSRDCIKILSPAASVEYINSEGQCALVVADLAKVCGSYWPDLWPEESRPAIEKAVQLARHGEGTVLEAWRPSPTGHKSWWQVSVSPLQESSGELAGILTISRNTTEHVALRESERTLMLEMKHRLRNAYTVASAIVTQSARGGVEHRSFAESVSNRLADIALAQTRLLEAGEKSWTVAELIQTLVAAHGESATGVRYTGKANIDVDGHQAMLIALVIGELTNNSLKYGALKNGKQLRLSWTANERLTIRWHEPLARPLASPLGARASGSGYSLMTRMAKSQRALFKFEADDVELRAELSMEYNAEGN